MKPKPFAKKRLKFMWGHVLNPTKGMPFVRMLFTTAEQREEIDREYRRKSKELDRDAILENIEKLKSSLPDNIEEEIFTGGA